MNNFQKIPTDLRVASSWLVWKLGPLNPKTGRRPKLPCNHATGDVTDKADPSVWTSFEEAISKAGKFSGIGLLPMGKVIGFDLDKCRNKETGEINAWARDWVAKLNSYTEISPSGDGLHVWFQGEAPQKGVARKDGAEVYAHGKQYLTVTGEHLEGTPLSLRTFTKAETAEVFERVRQGKSVKAPAASTSLPAPQKLQRLLDGDISAANTTDTSAAVHSCLTMLALETICDREQMEQCFKGSRLYKETHWKEKWGRLRETELDKACANAREHLRKGQPKKSETIDPDSWRELFTTYAEDDDPLFDWLVKDLIEVGGAHGIAGPSGNGKTLFGVSLAKALVLGKPFLNHFEVSKPCGVLYLIPESGSRSFRKRLRSFRLTLEDDRFLYRTLSHGVTIPLHDPRMLAAVKGRVIFLDTAIRFIQGDENSASENHKYLAQDVFNLLSAGALAVILIHHATKAGAEGDVMTLENVLRGSGDIGAMLNNVYGLRQINKPANLIHVEQVKARDIEYLPPFQVEGRPWIDDEGDFRLKKKPGECGSLKEEKKDGKTDKHRQVLELVRTGKSYRQIEEMTGVPTSTAQRWVKESNKQGQLNIEEDDHGM
jgi:hypothetical protein